MKLLLIFFIFLYCTGSGLTFLFNYFFSKVFLLPYCGLLYRCGCTFEFWGGVSKCNINDPHSIHKW